MFIEISRGEEVAAFVGTVLSFEGDTFKKRFIAMLSKLNEADWKFLEAKAMELVGESKKN